MTPLLEEIWGFSKLPWDRPELLVPENRTPHGFLKMLVFKKNDKLVCLKKSYIPFEFLYVLYGHSKSYCLHHVDLATTSCIALIFLIWRLGRKQELENEPIPPKEWQLILYLMMWVSTRGVRIFPQLLHHLILLPLIRLHQSQLLPRVQLFNLQPQLSVSVSLMGILGEPYRC